MLPYLTVCPLIFVGGLVDALAGGGGLITLPAYLFAGIPMHVALGSNKLSSALGTCVSTGRYLKNGYVNMKIAVPTVVAALLGSAGGANLALLVPEQILKFLLIPILPLAAYYVLRKKDLGEEKVDGEELSSKKLLVYASLIAFFIGGYDGFYGPGTGTFILLLFTGICHMDLKTASGNTKIINLSSNIAALVTFIINGKVYYSLALAASVFSILGHYTGSSMLMNNGSKAVRPVILVVLGLLFIKIITGN